MLQEIIRFQFDPENYSNYQFARAVALEIPKESFVLDAGAGERPYAGLYSQHRYISTDYGGERTVEKPAAHEFFSDLAHLPVTDNVFDAILCYQVLEHVPYPEQVLQELYRTLRPGGSLYLTVPQGWGLHHEPHHYFNFTRYGLALLFNDVGFKNIRIEERGGIFWMLAKRAKILPYYVLFQYAYPLFKPEQAKSLHLRSDRWHNLVWSILLIPFYLLSLPFLLWIIPLIFFYIDSLDQRRLYCLGYQCRCQKPLSNASLGDR